MDADNVLRDYQQAKSKVAMIRGQAFTETTPNEIADLRLCEMLALMSLSLIRSNVRLRRIISGVEASILDAQLALMSMDPPEFFESQIL